MLLNPLPFPHPEQLVALHESKPNFANGSISYPNFLDRRKDNHTFAAMGLARGYGFSMTGRGDAAQLSAEFLSDGYFAVLGVWPLLGREFTPTDETLGASPVAMISEDRHRAVHQSGGGRWRSGKISFWTNCDEAVVAALESRNNGKITFREAQALSEIYSEAP